MAEKNKERVSDWEEYGASTYSLECFDRILANLHAPRIKHLCASQVLEEKDRCKMYTLVLQSGDLPIHDSNTERQFDSAHSDDIHE